MGIASAYHKFRSDPGVKARSFKAGMLTGCDIQPSWCHQLENFSWIVPNNPAINFSSFYANFHNQPQNLTQQCLDLFGKNKTVASPAPNALQSVFGPFPIIPTSVNASWFLSFNRSNDASSYSYSTFPVIAQNNGEATLKNFTLNYNSEIC